MNEYISATDGPGNVLRAEQLDIEIRAQSGFGTSGDVGYSMPVAPQSSDLSRHVSPALLAIAGAASIAALLAGLLRMRRAERQMAAMIFDAHTP